MATPPTEHSHSDARAPHQDVAHSDGHALPQDVIIIQEREAESSNGNEFVGSKFQHPNIYLVFLVL